MDDFRSPGARITRALFGLTLMLVGVALGAYGSFTAIASYYGWLDAWAQGVCAWVGAMVILALGRSVLKGA